MKLTIIPVDNAVYVNGVCKAPLNILLCGIPTNVHALQWLENAGWIEFNSLNVFDLKPANQNINDLPEWALSAYQCWVDDNFIIS